MVRYRETRSIAEEFFKTRDDYDLARPSIYRQPKQGVLSSGSGANWHIRIQQSYFSMVELARELFRNNPLVAQGIRRMVSNIVQGGFTPDPDTGDRGVDKELKARWDTWSQNPKECSLDGEKTFWDMESLIVQHVVVDGDVLGIPMRSGSLWPVENHRLRTPTNVSRKRKNHVVHGVEMDEYQRRMRYWITNQDWDIRQSVRRVSDVTKYNAFTVDKLTGKPERQVYHLYRPDRLSQTRGITALAAIGDTAGMTSDLFFAQLVKAQAASCYTFLHELAANVEPPVGTPGGTTQPNVWPPEHYSRQIDGIQPGTDIYTDMPGEKITGFTPNIPNPEFFEHASFLLTLLAINLDLPLCVFLLDPTKTNFSGWRGATDQMKMRFRDFQRWLATHFHREVWRWRTRVALAEDAVLRNTFGKIGEKIFKHIWQLPSWPYIEPSKDAIADTIEEASCTNSARRIMARKGLDFDDISREVVRDNVSRIGRAIRGAQHLTKKYGVEVDWHEVLAKPLPQGMSIRLSDINAPGESGNGSGTPTKNKSAGTEPAKTGE